MSPKYRYKFRCYCNALFSCFRLILSIQTNVLKLYRETPTECLAISTPCSPSNEECHLMLRRDKKFSCLHRIRRQRNQLYPFLQINLQCLTYYIYSSQTRFNNYTPCRSEPSTNGNFTQLSCAWQHACPTTDEGTTPWDLSLLLHLGHCGCSYVAGTWILCMHTPWESRFVKRLTTSPTILLLLAQFPRFMVSDCWPEQIDFCKSNVQKRGSKGLGL